MTKKIMEAYAWVDEQEDCWDNIAEKKSKQLENITKSHLDWFDNHTTINDILAWKRPVVQSKNENVNKQNGEIEVKSTRSVNSVSLNRQESISKMNDLPDQDTLSESSNKPSIYKERKTVSEGDENDEDGETIIEPSTKNIDNSTNGLTLQLHSEGNSVKEDSLPPEASDDEESSDLYTAPELRLLFRKKDKPDDITEIPSPTHPLADSTTTDDIHNESYKQNPGQSDTITNTEDDTRRTPELDTETNTQSQKIPTTPKSYEDEYEDGTNTPCITSPIRHINNNDDDDDDEIQLVVSKRHFGDNAALSPARKALNQYTNTSPIRTASERYIQGSPVRNSTQLKSPTSNASPVRYQSPFMSRLFQLAQSPNSRDSKGSVSSYITVRPKPSESVNSTTNEKENNIRLSLFENPAQKRRIELVEEPRMSAIEVSGVMPQPHFKKPKSMSLRKTNPVSNIPTTAAGTVDETKKSEKVEVDRPIPSWSMSPELYTHLRNQENIDPDSIFSDIPPLDLKEIFANPEIYLLLE